MRILFFTYPSWNHPAIGSNVQGLIKGFEELGHTVVLCLLNDVQSLTQAADMIYVKNNLDFTIGMNNFGMNMLSQQPETPHVSVLLDEPFNNHCIGYEAPLPKHLITYLDRSDNDILKYIFSLPKYVSKYKKHTLFMPLGGGMNKQPEERCYDIVYSSGFWPIDDVPSWKKTDSDINNTRLLSILDDVLYIMQNFPVNVRDAFNEALKSRGMYDEEYLHFCMPHFWRVLSYAKPWRKIETVKKLAATGRTIHLIGNGSPSGSWKDYVSGKNVIFHGALMFDETLKIIGNSKILVTDEACFNDGAHDRVFTGMLNGAAVVAEYSSYLDEQFTNQEDIFFYDWQHTDEHLGIVHKLLDDDDFRLSAVKKAYNIAINGHTWTNRAKKILDTLAILYDIK